MEESEDSWNTLTKGASAEIGVSIEDRGVPKSPRSKPTATIEKWLSEDEASLQERGTKG
jgi:hypothetical protein